MTKIETFHAFAGWRNLSSLKVMTDEGIIGFGEYSESFESKGVNSVIESLATLVKGVILLRTMSGHRDYTPVRDWLVAGLMLRL